MKQIILILLTLYLIIVACGTNPVGFNQNTDWENSQGHGGGYPYTDENTEITDVHALIVYAQDTGDEYALPDQDFRNRLYERISEYFWVMSYHQHRLHFHEVLQNGDYFRTDHDESYYKSEFKKVSRAEVCDGPFALYNREILDKVLQDKGAAIFEGIDLLIMVTTDGGPDWYLPSVNAQGYARLGIDFEVNDKVFGAKYGGITIEIGSDFIQELYPETQLYWILAHEYGHWLGFRRHRSRNVGIYSLMTEQMFANQTMLDNKMGPSPLDPLLINQFGWLDFEDSTRVKKILPRDSEVMVQLNPIRSTRGVVLAQISLPGTIPTDSTRYTAEYFYVAYHKKELNQFDDIYAGEGILIWHSVMDKYLDLECSQGLSDQPNRDHLDIGEDMGGLDTDFFVPQKQDEFTVNSNPNTNIWGITNTKMADHPSGVSITDIQEIGDMVQFRVVFSK